MKPWTFETTYPGQLVVRALGVLGRRWGLAIVLSRRSSPVDRVYFGSEPEPVLVKEVLRR